MVVTSPLQIPAIYLDGIGIDRKHLSIQSIYVGNITTSNTTNMFGWDWMVITSPVKIPTIYLGGIGQ